ncbi:MAG: hypothetical protein IJU49_06735 [Lachnospiraceae bacterium]|nr:hypothetical protein [Lachnospiraceae bacterium]
MKKKTKFTLLLPALLALLLALVPSEALKPQEVHAAKAPRLNVVMASESGFVVELLAQDTMTLSAFGGNLRFNYNLLEMTAFQTDLPNSALDNNSIDMPGSHYADVFCTGSSWTVTSGTALCRWAFRSTSADRKLKCLSQYYFQYEAEWAEGPSAWNTGALFEGEVISGHWYDAGKVTKAATCTAAGVRTRTCSHCGATTTENIPAAGHKPVSIPAKAATCTETGLTEGRKCSACGIILTQQQTTPALGHDWDEGVTSIEAGELFTGVTMYTCKRCKTTRDVPYESSPDDVFEYTRGYKPRRPDEKPLDIYWQPRDGKVAYDGSETFNVRVEVMDGTEPYTYAWYRESHRINERGQLLTAALSDKTVQIKGTYEDLASRFQQKWGKPNDQYGDISGKSGISLLSTLIQDSEKPYINVSQGDAYYYCVITDAAGRTATSNKAYVGWKVYFDKQPESLIYSRSLLDRDADPKIEVAAAGGTAPYEYVWYEYDKNKPYTEWKLIDAQTGSVLKPGAGVPENVLLACVVKDAEGDFSVSRPVQIEHEPLLRILALKATPEEVEAGQPFTLSAYVMEAPKAYQAEWSLGNQKWTCKDPVADTYEGTSCYRYDAEVTGQGVFKFYVRTAEGEYNESYIYKQAIPGTGAPGDEFMAYVTSYTCVVDLDQNNIGTGYASLKIVGGVGPYTVEWYHSPAVKGKEPEFKDYQILRRDKVYRTGHYEGTEWFDDLVDHYEMQWYQATMPFPVQEYLAVKVIDAAGSEVIKQGAPAVYCGDTPYFAKQPSYLSIPCDEFGKQEYYLECQALTTNDSPDGIKYIWQKWDDKKWDWVTVSGYSTDPKYPITSADQAGKYRVIARDIHSGKGAWSGSAWVYAAPEYMGVTKSFVKNNVQYGLFTFKYATGPVRVEVTSLHGYTMKYEDRAGVWTLGEKNEKFTIISNQDGQIVILAGMYKYHEQEDPPRLHMTTDGPRYLTEFTLYTVTLTDGTGLQVKSDPVKP